LTTLEHAKTLLAKALRNTPLRLGYHWAKSRLSFGSSQSDEARIVRELAFSEDAPKTFVEFGFHPTEFNCIGLPPDFEGVLIDGDASTVRLAKLILPDRLKAIHKFLTLENIGIVRDCFPQLGVLSIDVNGNDYWLLKSLIASSPAVISVEYNASLGNEPITMPYIEDFNRFTAHDSNWYHGASLSALAKLCANNGYGLAAVSAGGMNAFFTRSGSLDASTEWRPHESRCRLSGTSTSEQWATIGHLPFVRV
jgi:hypothetical protein